MKVKVLGLLCLRKLKVLEKPWTVRRGYLEKGPHGDYMGSQTYTRPSLKRPKNFPMKILWESSDLPKGKSEYPRNWPWEFFSRQPLVL